MGNWNHVYKRDITSLLLNGKKRQQIASALGISYLTVQHCVNIAESNGGQVLTFLDEAELKKVFYPNAPGRKSSNEKLEPDFVYLLSQLKLKGVTKQLLYREYKESNPNNYYSYSSFCQQIRDYSQSCELSMILKHEPGKKAFIDYCGDKVPIYDRSSGQVRYKAEIFVMTLAYSGYSYFEAHRFQNQESFVGGITRSLSYFGGVVEILVPDNQKQELSQIQN